MKTQEGLQKLLSLQNKTMKEILSQEEISWLRRDKGKAGKLVEIHIGLKNGPSSTDFEDGELKTYKAKMDRSPEETVAVRTIAGSIDELVGESLVAFEDSTLYKKIKNIIFLPICKQATDPADWVILEPFQVWLSPGSSEYEKMEEDYINIGLKLKDDIENSEDGFIHGTTSKGGTFLQVRSKDSKPYKPIISRHYGTAVSNKSYSFYFCMTYIKHLLSKEAYKGSV